MGNADHGKDAPDQQENTRRGNDLGLLRRKQEWHGEPCRRPHDQGGQQANEDGRGSELLSSLGLAGDEVGQRFGESKHGERPEESRPGHDGSQLALAGGPQEASRNIPVATANPARTIFVTKVLLSARSGPVATTHLLITSLCTHAYHAESASPGYDKAESPPDPPSKAFIQIAWRRAICVPGHGSCLPRRSASTI